MSSASRISASGISLAPASTIRIASSVPATIRSRSAVVEEVLLVGVDDEVAVDLADPHRADRRRERDVGDHQRGGGAVHGEDVVRVDVVDRERDRHELGLVAPALGEQRAERAVDHAGDERRLLARAALALEERAGDLPGRVHALLDVDRQREEVDVAEVAGGGGTEDHRVARADDDGAGGLLGQLAGLERDLLSADLDGDPRNGVRQYSIPFFLRPSVGGALRFFLLVPNATDGSGCAGIGVPMGVSGRSLARRARVQNAPVDRASSSGGEKPTLARRASTRSGIRAMLEWVVFDVPADRPALPAPARTPPRRPGPSPRRPTRSEPPPRCNRSHKRTARSALWYRNRTAQSSLHPPTSRSQEMTATKSRPPRNEADSPRRQPLGCARDRLPRPVHGRARRDRRERRAAVDPARPALLCLQPPVGRQRVHADVRRLPAARRPRG